MSEQEDLDDIICRLQEMRRDMFGLEEDASLTIDVKPAFSKFAWLSTNTEYGYGLQSVEITIISGRAGTKATNLKLAVSKCRELVDKIEKCIAGPPQLSEAIQKRDEPELEAIDDTMPPEDLSAIERMAQDRNVPIAVRGRNAIGQWIPALIAELRRLKERENEEQ
jgi:hypothetical protein